MTSADIMDLEILAEPSDSSDQVLSYGGWIDVQQVRDVCLRPPVSVNQQHDRSLLWRQSVHSTEQLRRDVRKSTVCDSSDVEREWLRSEPPYCALANAIQVADRVSDLAYAVPVFPCPTQRIHS